MSHGCALNPFYSQAATQKSIQLQMLREGYAALGHSWGG